VSLFGAWCHRIGNAGQQWYLPGGSGTPFSWYSADQLAEVIGGKLAALGDQITAQANHVVQATDAKRPSFSASWRQGLPAFTPTNGTGLSKIPYNNGAVSQPITQIAVGEWAPASSDPDSTGASYRILSQGQSDTAASCLYQRFVSAQYRARIFGGTEVDLVSNVSSWHGRAFVAISYLNGTSSKIKIRLHGLGSDISATVASTAGTNGQNGVFLGRGSGAANAGAGSWGAPIALVGSWLGAISDADRDYLIAKYAEKYGVVG